MYRYKILIVDDDTLLQASLDDILSEDYDTLIAGSGEEALRLFKSRPVDLVLLDIRLPGINGIETLRRIKELGGEAVVIMMTAYRGRQIRPQFHENGRLRLPRQAARY